MTRKSDPNSSSYGERGSFGDMDQRVGNIVEGIEKGARDTRAYDKERLSEIGSKGGESVSQDRDHISEIGKKGKARVVAEAMSDC